jgi:pimeloyl-ACP methyl ester carboxylesterase
VIILGRQHLRGRWDLVGGLSCFSRISKRETKTGEIPFVLVHGLGVSSRYMVPLANELAPRHPVYAPDLPGHGRSEKPKRVLNIRELAEALCDWLHAVRINRAVFVGNSMGCQVLVELADLHPACMLAAALLGPTMDQTVSSPLSHVVGLFKDQLWEPLSLIPLQAFDYLNNGPIRTIVEFRNALRHDMLARVSRLQAPCLVMRGEHDTIVSQPWVEMLAQHLPQADVQTISGAGHALNYNAAPTITPLILQFCREHGLSV